MERRTTRDGDPVQSVTYTTHIIRYQTINRETKYKKEDCTEMTRRTEGLTLTQLEGAAAITIGHV